MAPEAGGSRDVDISFSNHDSERRAIYGGGTGLLDKGTFFWNVAVVVAVSERCQVLLGWALFWEQRAEWELGQKLGVSKKIDGWTYQPKGVTQ